MIKIFFVILCITQNLILCSSKPGRSAQKISSQRAASAALAISPDNSPVETNLRPVSLPGPALPLPEEDHSSAILRRGSSNPSLTPYKDFEELTDEDAVGDIQSNGRPLDDFVHKARCCARIVRELGARYGALSKIKYLNALSESNEHFRNFIAKSATPGNPFNGYRDLENAMLEAIATNKIENIQEALQLFDTIQSDKSCLTPQALKKLSDAAKKYQEHLDENFLKVALAYLEETNTLTFLIAEADTPGSRSNFQKQTPDTLETASKIALARLKDLASKNVVPDTEE